VVAQGDHRAQVLPGPAGGRLVDHDDPVVGQEDLVAALDPGRERRSQRGREPELVDAAADRVVGQREQPAGLLVEQLQPARTVEEQQALADRVQHGVVVLVHPAQLGRPEVVRRAP
jgi:hypothetical protein